MKIKKLRRQKVKCKIFSVFTILFILLNVVKTETKIFVSANIKTRILPLEQDFTKTLDEVRWSIGEIVLDDLNKTIDESGLYILGQDISAPITITTDNVVINLNGYEVLDNNGTTTGIVIEDNLKNILIKNGSIRGYGENSSSAGILISQGSSIVKAKNIRIKDFDIGIHLDGINTGTIKACNFKNCLLKSNKKGVYSNYTLKCIFENCKAYNCKEAGFDQLNSQFNIFDKCESLKTTNEDPATNAVGFSSESGIGNLFCECIANGTKKSNSTLGTYAAGFVLKDIESKSKIINCIATNSEIEGNGKAYGILAQPTLTPICKEDYIYYGEHGTDLNATDWGCNLRYIAVGGLESSTPAAFLRIFEFNYSNPLQSFDYEFEPPYSNVTDLKWSSDCQYLAVVTEKSGGTDGEIIVFKFNPTATSPSNRLYEVDSYEIKNSNFSSVDWSKGKYLDQYIAASLRTGPTEIKVVGFDRNTEKLILPVTDVPTTANVEEIVFSSNGLFLFAVWNGKIEIYKFDPNNIIRYVDDFATGLNGSLGIDVIKSCANNYIIAIGGDTDSNPKDIQVYSYDGQLNSNPTLIAQAEHGGDIMTVRWSEDGTSLIVSGDADGNGKEVKLFGFNCEGDINNRLQELCAYNYPGNSTATDLDFSPNQKFIVSVGENVTTPDGDIDTVIFELYYTPTKNIIRNNEVSSCRGGLGGIGISADSMSNLVIQNIAYENGINYSSGIFNKYVGGLNGNPSNIINLSVPPYEN